MKNNIYLYFVLIGFCFLGCKKDEDPIDKFSFLLGNWNIEETRRVFEDPTGSPDVFTNQLSINFKVDNTGNLNSIFGVSSFIWSVQLSPDKLHISEELNSIDSTPINLFNNSFFSILECREDFLWVADKKTTSTAGGQSIVVERQWELTR